jgi:hypothetical protein
MPVSGDTEQVARHVLSASPSRGRSLFARIAARGAPIREAVDVIARGCNQDGIEIRFKEVFGCRWPQLDEERRQLHKRVAWSLVNI